MSKKPNAAAIRAALPLSELPTRPADPLSACNICGNPAAELVLYREADEYDNAGPEGALVYIGKDHRACTAAMEKHPRLYVDAMGKPGEFPLLCAPCVFRKGLACTHADLKANGGPGLAVACRALDEHYVGMEGARVCTRGKGCWTPPLVAKSCKGRRLLQLVPAPAEGAAP
jgi:hypothetical protein